MRRGFRFILVVFCLLGSAFIFKVDTAQQPNTPNPFKVSVSMKGSTKNPDPVFENLVKTYVRRELRRIPDVKVVPLEANSGFYFVHMMGWETDQSGNYSLSVVLTFGRGAFAFYEQMWLQTANRKDLEEHCVGLVGMIDDHLDVKRIRLNSK